MKNKHRVHVLGAGSWGTTLALMATKAQDKTYLWTRDVAIMEDINTSHSNHRYLPGVMLPSKLVASTDLSEVLACETLLVSIPVQALRGVCEKIAAIGINRNTALVLCSKGIESESLKLTTDIISDVLPEHPLVAVLSGPNFAREVALGQPTASSLACADKTVAITLAHRLGTPVFRVYPTTDIIGVQIAGAVKNVLAIACGIARGVGLGENTVAALITRGLTEISRLIEAKGGRVRTVMGLAGFGDVMLTCSSLTSRNTSFGLALGKGTSLDNALAEQKGVVEGFKTAESVYHLAKQLGVDMPICAQVYGILYCQTDIDESIHHLLARPLADEE